MTSVGAEIRLLELPVTYGVKIPQSYSYSWP